MDKVIAELKEKHSITVTKDCFKSIVHLRPHIDKLLSSILMGQLVLSSNITEASDIFTENNPEFEKSTNFLKTFESEADGYDDVVALKLVRFSCFIKYLLKLQDLKITFNINDMVESKVPHMVNLMSSLSSLAAFSNDIAKDVNKVVSDVIKDKQNQAAYTTELDMQEQELLKDYESFDELVEQTKRNQIRNDILAKKYADVIEKDKQLTHDIMIEEEHRRQLELSFAQVTANHQGIDDECASLRGRIVENPENLAAELARVKAEIDSFTEKTRELASDYSDNTIKLAKVRSMLPFKDILNDKIVQMKSNSEKLLHNNQVIASLDQKYLSKAEKIKELAKEKQSRLDNITSMQQKKERLDSDTKRSRESVIEQQRLKIEAKEKAENLRQRIKDFKMPAKAEIIRERERRAAITEEYNNSLVNLANNAAKSVDELMERYDSL